VAELATRATCVDCATPLVNPQRCRACGRLQPPDPQRDHFATLGLPRAFAIDPEALERRVVEFGRELHPDKSGGDAAAKSRAMLASAQLNEAYSILRDDYRRAEYLLKLEGGKPASEEKSVPEGFLERMLDERMELEEALHGDPDRVAAVRRRFEQEIARCTAEMAPRFAALHRAEGSGSSTATDHAELLVSLRRTLNVMAYYRGLLRDLREAVRDKE
jgi:molecular chaperone HscB